MSGNGVELEELLSVEVEVAAVEGGELLLADPDNEFPLQETILIVGIVGSGQHHAREFPGGNHALSAVHLELCRLGAGDENRQERNRCPEVAVDVRICVTADAVDDAEGASSQLLEARDHNLLQRLWGAACLVTVSVPMENLHVPALSEMQDFLALSLLGSPTIRTAHMQI